MRRDYKIGIAVALLLVVCLAVYFFLNNNNNTATEDTDKDPQNVKNDNSSRDVSTTTGNHGFRSSPGDTSNTGSGSDIIKVSQRKQSDNLIPPTGNQVTKTTQEKGADPIVKSTGGFGNSTTENRTVTRRPAVLVDDESDTGREPLPSFSSRTPGADSPSLTKTGPEPTRTTTDTDKMRYHKVREGENGFAAIAKIEYGNAKYWTLIRDANPGVETTSLHVGDVLKIPPLPKTTGGATRVEDTAKHGTVTKTIGGGSTYVVKEGDSYWDIAKEQYGDGSLYTIIQEANKDVPPDKLKPGQKIILPPKPVKTEVASRTTSSSPPVRTTETTAKRTAERTETPSETSSPDVVRNSSGEAFD